MRNLRIRSVGIGELLMNNNFIVPIYQRSYAWSAQYVHNLLTDLSDAIKRKKEKKGDTYFLGSIVVISRPSTPNLEVVDGQQRLATVSIILAAIRDFHLNNRKDRAAGEYDQYLRAYHIPTGRHNAKLRLNEVDDRCYANAIVEVPAKRQNTSWSLASHKRIIAAYQKAVEFVDAIDSTNTPKRTISHLYELVEFLRSDAQAILVQVDDDADAFTIFETLNDRHLVLSVSDLLKNFLFKTTGEAIEEAKGNWREMQGALQTLKGKKDRTVDYVRQLWGSMHGLVREKDLFRDIKAKIVAEEEARDFSSALAAQAPDYVAVLNPHNEAWDKYGSAARSALATFNSLRVERIRPLLLAVLNRFEEKDVLKALSFLRSATVRIVAVTGINGTVEEAIYELAVKVHKKEIRRASQLARQMTFVPNDAVFEAQFATMNVTKAALARFYLLELEDARKGDQDDERVVNRDERKVNLEHIIPASETERGAYWPQLTPDEGDKLSRRLGNLALLSNKVNSKLNGGPFSKKVKAYAECGGIYLTSEIAEKYDDWGAEQVEDRQRTLAKLALVAWPLSTNSRAKR